MKLPASVRHFALSAIAATTLAGTIFVTPALAQDAVLRGSTPTSEINLRADASTNSSILGYGVTGDRVQILRQTRGQDGNTWYQVRFYQTNATGWIRSDFLTLQNTTPTNPNPQDRALRTCEARVRQQFPNSRVQVTYDPRDRSGLYRVNWTTSNGETGYCQVNRDGTLVSFVRGNDNTGITPDRTQEARRRQLEAEFTDQLVGLTRDQAIRVLNADGYRPVDDRVGRITFSVDRQAFQTVVTYDRRTRRVQRVQVSSQVAQPPQNDARARQLEAEISDLVLGLFYDEAIGVLQDEGYTPVDNGRGSITFRADRGRYPVTVSYSTQTERVNRVRVATGDVVEPVPGPNETVVSFQTPTYAVRVFRRNGQLLMNVFNQQTRVQELTEAVTTKEDFGSGVSYNARRGDRTYFARVVTDNFYALDIFSGNRQLIGERGTKNFQGVGLQR